MNQNNNDTCVENIHDTEEPGNEAENRSDGKEYGSNDENSNNEKNSQSRNERKAKDDCFIKKAVLGDYEVTVNSINLKNPAYILEKLCPLKDDETLTNEEKSQQVMNIILEYME
jgi:hypothetical protein